MAKKKLLLNESVTRRFMKLATIKPTYVSNFITEAEEEDELALDGDEPAPPADEPALDADPPEDPMMDPGLETEDELDDPVGDAGGAEDLVMDLLAKVQEFAKENGVSMELEGDDDEDELDEPDADGMEAELDDAEPEGGDLPGEADEPAPALDAPEEGGEELALQENVDQDAIVAEVTKRVARRLLKESAKRK
ncbi:MAG: hypothetical protein GOVbin703_148 [Prokaryotic dsDNA virus sp.]|nr:MAG: hypothetical protein GOVbin703_148 [Prokaryotic dsDNA virus sp.]|tara:strand:- start:8550 stop:9131 length:582 start_codon:yes stop_codon:yes gene_type:complete